MDDSAIYARLNDIFRDIFDDDAIELTPQTTAADIPDWDSLNHVNISVACENAFGIRFRSSELEELRNVGGLVALIKTKLAAK
jgi:acyl carrier protein